MDTNRDGIIDDPLATKAKRGRKSLGLTKEEMKKRRALQRKIRLYNKRYEKRKQDVTTLVLAIAALAPERGLNKVIEDLITDAKWEINYNPEARPISGYSGERLRRKKN